MFQRLRSALSSAVTQLSRNKYLTREDIATISQTMTDALLDADVPFDAAESFVTEVSQALVGARIPGSVKAEEYILKVFHDKVRTFLGDNIDASAPAQPVWKNPSMTLVMGLQGAGKTTTIGKLATYLQRHAQSNSQKEPAILCASVDFHRPAARDQLRVGAEKVGIAYYEAQSADPAEAAAEIKTYAAQQGYDVVLLDTAGRLHVDRSMMDEIKAVRDAVDPTHTFLVLDAMTGQESLSVSQSFASEVGFTSAILTKMDSDARGGAAFAFRYTLGKPISFVGAGEKHDDLEVFRPDRIAQRMLDMGDVMTLVERANEKIEQAEYGRIQTSLMEGTLTLEDFAQQLRMVSKMGPLSSLMQYLPGSAASQVSSEEIQKGEEEAKKFLVIVSSMTQRERIRPRVLNRSRKQRIARGAGVGVADVEELLRRYKRSKNMVKKMQQGGLQQFFS